MFVNLSVLIDTNILTEELVRRDPKRDNIENWFRTQSVLVNNNYSVTSRQFMRRLFKRSQKRRKMNFNL